MRRSGGILSGQEGWMATKKSASKKTTGSDAKVETPVKAASKTAAAKKTAAKKTPEKTVSVHASAAAETHGHGAEAKGSKAHPSHHDIATHAYLLWERDGKKHGHQDHYWKQAEQELRG